MSVHASREISREEGRGSLALWFGVLGSPLAWGGHLVLNYSLEEWLACSPSAVPRGQILGLGVDTVSLGVNTLMALVAAASGLVAWRCSRKLKRASRDERVDRAHWLAFAGMVECVLFLTAILLGYAPPFFLGTCETTP
ncbi:MAG TPA: hypothetical protein VHE80_04735 [Acidimicrobiales bacterium]|nr:hypothetical protein [Acidimicrobiales bacterium]